MYCNDGFIWIDTYKCGVLERDQLLAPDDGEHLNLTFMLEKPEGAIKNGQSSDTGNILHNC